MKSGAQQIARMGSRAEVLNSDAQEVPSTNNISCRPMKMQPSASYQSRTSLRASAGGVLRSGTAERSVRRGRDGLQAANSSIAHKHPTRISDDLRHSVNPKSSFQNSLSTNFHRMSAPPIARNA